MKLSVIVPTHNRNDKLLDTLNSLKQQDLASDEYEIIVVDDASSPRVVLPEVAGAPRCILVRLEGVERSAARNRGSAIANAELLVFLDDDMTVGADFLSTHLRAQSEWPGALVVGSVRLTDKVSATPFGHFRNILESRGIPASRGLTVIPNFCTAQNASILKQRFIELGGFDESIVSGEDQDLALRHTETGGLIAFLPEAVAEHHDNASDIRSYCRRTTWGCENMNVFCRRHPNWPENLERARVNGAVRWGREPFLESVRKLVKIAIGARLITTLFFAGTTILERIAPKSLALDRAYRLLLGVHILRGYRNGIRNSAHANDEDKDGPQVRLVSDQS
jgi:GT2 family glycosyltransferase